MKKCKLLGFIAVLILVLSACTFGPSVCEDREGQISYLCDVADQTGVKLEDVGNLLIIANAVAIESRVYSVVEARIVFESLLEVVDSSPSYIFIKNAVVDEALKYPGLFIIAEVYISQMNQTQIISKFDREILSIWLQKQIDILDN